MQIPILEGRGFSQNDRHDGRPVIVVNRAMAERYWPGESAVGRVVRIDATSWEVVGVVENSIAFTMDEQAPHLIYVPMEQEPRRRRFLMASVEGDAESYAQAVLATAREEDEAQSVTNARGMQRVVTTSMAPWLGAIGGLSLLGFSALALAAMGIYGVVSFSVQRPS